jgi:hypothetical protein
VKPLIVEEAAELELIGSVAFYEERKTGLGLDFAAATRQALNTIAAAPALAHRKTRYEALHHAPFSVCDSLY